MHNHKFFALFMLGMLLFTAVMCTGGCGGSSGSAVGVNTNPTPNQSPDVIPVPEPSQIYYTVTFDSDGGSRVPSQKVPAGGTVTKPEDPVKEGYAFSGWFKDEGRTVLFKFGENGDKVTQDITLYAGWTELASTALAEAEYALAHIAIGYQGGDNPNYVTENLTLPVSVDVADDVTITWTSSNTSTISNSGTVNRQAGDTKVTLTVKVTKDSESAEKTFEVTVIRRRSRTIEQAKSEIHVNGVTEIRAMNVSNDELQITYSESRDRVTDIDGKYADFAIETADDALDAVQSLHGILGINDPYEELEANVITSDAYGAEYTFSQVYDGVGVFGRNVTVSANSADEGDFITSSVVPSSRLANANLNFTYSQEQAENAAKERYTGSIDVRPDNTEKLIFTLYDYENNPVPAYVVNVYGQDSEDKNLDENVYVNALNGEVIFNSTNLHDAEAVEEREAEDELFKLTDTTRKFPVVPLQILGNTYYIMRDPETNVEVYNHSYVIFGGRYTHVSFGEHDAQQVSAYANMIDVMKWWKTSFDRNSLDGNGMTVKVITHFPFKRDNATWSGIQKFIIVCDASDNLRSCAAVVDVMAHESTHAVFGYRRGSDFPYEYSYNSATGIEHASGAIDEGYADVFACLMSGQWKIGLHVHADHDYSRNIADPADTAARQNIDSLAGLNYAHAPKTWSERYTGTDDNGGVHLNSSLVSYPAYLMNTTYGISTNDLAEIWYESMRMGYSATSNFKTVRTCVLRAAKKLGKSPEIISGIKKAFDDVGIKEESSTLRGTVSQYNGNALSGVSVSETPMSTSSPATSNSYSPSGNTSVTDASGKFSFELAVGLHRLDISHAGYVPFKAITYVEEALDNVLDIPLVTPSGTTLSTLIGTVRDSESGNLVGGGTLKIWEGWNFHTGTTVSEITVSDNGSYTVSLPAGYYTADFSKTGYITTSINNLVISSDETIRRDIILSQTTDNKYRVTLQWDENPRDLDAHLIGPLPYGRSFHVYFSHKTATDSQGNIVAQLDHDDTRGNGFETITFSMKPGDQFKYFVHWYAGNGTWSGSNALVNLYKGSELIGTYPVPNVASDGNTAGRYWHVFDLTDGLDPVQPAQTDAISSREPTLNSQSSSYLHGTTYYPQKTR